MAVLRGMRIKADHDDMVPVGDDLGLVDIGKFDATTVLLSEGLLVVVHLVKEDV